MKKANYIQLLSAVVTTILLVVSVTILHPFGDIESTLKSGIVVIGALLSLIVIFSVFQITIRNRDSVWFKPVSTRVSKIIINTVVVIWLSAIGLFTLMVLFIKGESPTVTSIIILSLVGSAWLGRYLKRYFSSYSLLSCGVSFFAAFVINVALFALPIP